MLENGFEQARSFAWREPTTCALIAILEWVPSQRGERKQVERVKWEITLYDSV